MKKIINRKRYDTENATKLIDFEPYLNKKDPKNFMETLYIASNGSFFLYGRGGPLSEWSGEEDIVPMTKLEALDWIFELPDGVDCDDVLTKYFDSDTPEA